MNWMSPEPNMAGVLIKRGTFGLGDADTHESRQVTAEAETAVVWLQAEGCRDLPGARKLEEAGGAPPHRFRGAWPCSQTSGLQK